MPWKGCARRWRRQGCRKRPRRRSLLRASDWGGHDPRRVPGPAPRPCLRRAGRAARRRGGEPCRGMRRVPQGKGGARGDAPDGGAPARVGGAVAGVRRQDPGCRARPLGLGAPRIDAPGPVKALSTRRDRPRWIVRAALGGSVAAAAALVLVVSNTLETRRNAEKANALRSDEYAIRVQTAADSLDSALRDAEAKRDKDRVETMKLEAAPPAPPAALEKEKVAQLSAPAHKPAKKAGTSGVRIEGGGGDAAGKTVSKNTPAPPRESDAARTAARASTAAPSAGATKSAPPAAGSIRMQTARERDASGD